MSRLELKLEGWGKENQSAESIDTDAPASSESKPISRFDGHEFGYTYVGTTVYSAEKVFEILNDYLQPDTETPLYSAIQSILTLLPENAPLSSEVWNVGEVVLQLAEQIPYHHPSQIKLARVMEELTCSPKFTTGLSEKNVLYMRGQRFKESLRDWYNGPGEDKPQAWANLNAFFAHEASTHIRPHYPDFAIWTMRDAFEEPAEPTHGVSSFKGMRDQQIIAAAQYILWDGQELFKNVLDPDLIDDTEAWRPGVLYFGDSSLSLKRWRFWKDGFSKAAGEESNMADECRKVSAKVAALMEALEVSMMF